MDKFLLFLIMFPLQFIWAQGNSVIVGNSYSDYIKVIDVYENNSSTVVQLEFNPITNRTGLILHSPSGKSPYIITDKKGNRYALKSQTGWNGSESGGFGTKTINANEKIIVNLYFNKLKSITDIYSLTEVDCDGTNCWNFYDIKVTAKVEATLDKTWIDYDVYDNEGNFGIKIHNKFYINYMKDTPFYLKLRIMKGEEFLKTTDVLYKDVLNQILLQKRLQTPYSKAVYNDQHLFLPYKLLRGVLDEGINELKIDIDLYYEDGKLLKHLGLKDYTYTKR